MAISNPGRLTASEVLASGAAIKINNVATLPYKMTRLLADKKRLRQLKQNAAKLARPQAAFSVAKVALRFARSRGSMLQA